MHITRLTSTLHVAYFIETGGKLLLISSIYLLASGIVCLDEGVFEISVYNLRNSVYFKYSFTKRQYPCRYGCLWDLEWIKRLQTANYSPSTV